MKKQSYSFFSIIFFLVSCGQQNRLSEDDYLWMPYKGNEILVFKSNIGDTDTIFISKKDTLLAFPDAQSLNGIEYEIVSVSCRYSNSETSRGKHRYLERRFFEVRKARDSRAELDILLSAEDAKFYRLSRIRIDSLNKVNPVVLETSHRRYNDVYVIYAEDYLDNFKERSDYIEKLYWSKSKGLIRYDKKNNMYWELN